MEIADFTAKSSLIYRTELTFKGSNENIAILSGEQGRGLTNYYLSHCPEGITGVRSYNSVTFENVYDGIDLLWHSNEKSLEYDFILSANADYHLIQTEIKGSDEIFVDDESFLVINTPLGSIVQAPPTVYQSGNILPSRWVIKGDLVYLIR